MKKNYYQSNCALIAGLLIEQDNWVFSDKGNYFRISSVEIP